MHSLSKLLFIGTLLLVSITCAFAQQNDDQLVVKKRFVYKNDQKLDSQELKAILTNYTESKVEFEKYKANSTVGSSSFLIAGGFALYLGVTGLKSAQNDVKSLQSGSLETSDGKNLILPAIATVGFASIGAFFMLASNKNLRRSINVYNSKLKTSNNSLPKVELGITQNGIGLICQF